MGKIGFIFPGQGAQAHGMGASIVSKHKDSQKVFEAGNQLLDFDLEALCFSDNVLINQTDYTQPALLVVSMALLKAVESLGIQADYVGGLSLGEYSALVANGALSFEDAVVLTRRRGQFMEAAAKASKGGMAAILGSDEATILTVLSEVEGYVAIANYNNAKQIVISGESIAVKAAVARFEDMGIKAIPLNVSGAFHSELMAPAAKALEKELEVLTIQPFKVPYFSNVTGKMVQSHEQVKTLLIQQVCGSVRFEANIKEMLAQGVDWFIEIGPSQTLKGLIKKIDRKVLVSSIEDQDSFEALKAVWEERK